MLRQNIFILKTNIYFCSRRLQPMLEHLIENGTVKQAKHAVNCLNVMITNKERVFGQIIDVRKNYLLCL